MAEGKDKQANAGTYEDSLIIKGSKNKIRKVDERRIEYIKECITKQFMNLEENYVDFMCDEIYTKFYEE